MQMRRGFLGKQVNQWLTFDESQRVASYGRMVPRFRSSVGQHGDVTQIGAELAETGQLGQIQIGRIQPRCLQQRERTERRRVSSCTLINIYPLFIISLDSSVPSNHAELGTAAAARWHCHPLPPAPAPSVRPFISRTWLAFSLDLMRFIFIFIFLKNFNLLKLNPVGYFLLNEAWLWWTGR